MPYAPGNQNNAAEYIAQAGNDVAAGIRQFQQNDLMRSTDISKFYSTAQTDPALVQFLSDPTKAPPGVSKIYQKLNSTGHISVAEAAQLGSFTDLYTKNKVQQQTKADNDAKMAMEKERVALQGRSVTVDELRQKNEAANYGTNTQAQNDANAIVNAELYAKTLKPEEAPRRLAELMAQGGRDNDTRFQPAGTFVDMVTGGNPTSMVRNQRTGQLGTVDDKNVFKALDPSKWKPTSLNDANSYLDAPQFNQLFERINADENTVRAINRFTEGTKDLNQGASKLADVISRKAKIIFDAPDTDYTAAEKAIGISNARQQRLLGALRTTILGPGTLTENDAVRILQATGGDVTSLGTRLGDITQTMTEILSDKMNTYRQNVDLYNAHVTGRYSTAGYKQKKLVLPFYDVPQGAAPAPGAAGSAGAAQVGSGLSPEERRKQIAKLEAEIAADKANAESEATE